MNRIFFLVKKIDLALQIHVYKAHAYNTFIIIILLQNRYIYSITSSSAILKKSNALKNAFRRLCVEARFVTEKYVIMRNIAI